MEPLFWNIAQLVGLVLYLSYMRMQQVKVERKVDDLIKSSYNKQEVENMIDLKLAPLAVHLTAMQQDTADIKAMVAKLLDERRK